MGFLVFEILNSNKALLHQAKSLSEIKDNEKFRKQTTIIFKKILRHYKVIQKAIIKAKTYNLIFDFIF